jgi:hypothetical protein
MYIYGRFAFGFYYLLTPFVFILSEEKSNVDSLELRSVLAYLCLKPKVKCKFSEENFSSIFVCFA